MRSADLVMRTALVTTFMSCKEAILSESNETLTSTSTNTDTRPRRQARERLQSSVLEELWSIWRVNPRVPSVKSRRSWAISRSANSRLVDNWFTRRKRCAKKAGQPISDETYDLPIGSPIVPKREESPRHTEPGFEPFPDLPSDDTLVLVYPPDDDDLKSIDASSDTVFDEVVPAEPKETGTAAYREVLQQPCPEHDHSQPTPRFDAALFPLVIDSFGVSPADFDTTEDRCNRDLPLPENPFVPVCNQGQGNFTCVLCSTNSVQDEGLPNSNAMFNTSANLFASCPHLDFHLNTPSELSAIPFLLRTPRAVLPDNASSHPSVDSWTIVEDELGRLVNEGKLDFSFLNVPHFMSMELLV